MIGNLKQAAILNFSREIFHAESTCQTAQFEDILNHSQTIASGRFSVE